MAFIKQILKLHRFWTYGYGERNALILHVSVSLFLSPFVRAPQRIGLLDVENLRLYFFSYRSTDNITEKKKRRHFYWAVNLLNGFYEHSKSVSVRIFTHVTISMIIFTFAAQQPKIISCWLQHEQ